MCFDESANVHKNVTVILRNVDCSHIEFLI